MTESIIFAALQDIAYFLLLIGGGWFFGVAFYKIYKGQRCLQKRRSSRQSAAFTRSWA